MLISQLGYLVFDVSDLEAWRRLGTDVLGLTVEDHGAGLAWRHDTHRARFFIETGGSDDLVAVGWVARDDAALDALCTRLADAGVAVEEGTTAQAAARHVERLVCFIAPGGIPTELVVGPALADSPFQSEQVPGGFVAGSLGLGHVVLSSPSREQGERFYREVLGFELSDHIVTEVYGHPVDLAFMHTNGRHHSVAVGGPQRKRLHHFMVEASSPDAVGQAYDRTLAAGLRIMQTLGRHPNDQMFSFYARTPSGFQFEFGAQGRVIDLAEPWTPVTYDKISTWGHHPPQILAPRKRSAS
jgi:2,3-dihydroxybiphenyl 1,2-dioxygenase